MHFLRMSPTYVHVVVKVYGCPWVRCELFERFSVLFGNLLVHAGVINQWVCHRRFEGFMSYTLSANQELCWGKFSGAAVRALLGEMLLAVT